MTKSPRGPSLAQARDLMSNKHSHFHHRQRSSPYQPSEQHHQYSHKHQHQERQVPDAAGAPGKVDSFITRVVQTVSIVQIVDAAGSPIEIQTHFAEPATVLVDSASGVTVEAPGADALGVAPTSEPEPEPVPDPVLPTSEPEPVPAPVPEVSSDAVEVEPTHVPALSASLDAPASSQDEILTSTPFAAESASSAFPTISAALNSTSPSSFRAQSNDTSSLRLFAAPGSASLSLSDTYSSISNPRSSSLYTTTTTIFSSSTTASSTSSQGSSTPSATVGVLGGNGNSNDRPSESSAASSDDVDDSTPETGVIVGSVFGSIAGIALVAVLVLLALRWKKRNAGRITLGDDVNRGARALPAASSPPDDGGANAGMMQRSLPFGAAALAGIGAKRASKEQPSTPAGSGERGFYRVSGRKLTSVFESGGDGYTDPGENPFGNTNNRDSTMSGDSVLYRDSRAFFNDPSSDNGAGRLAVGSPMRPVSGVPIMRTGPAKTPVTETNPFADPLPDLQPPPSRDPIGRSLGSQDGSRGSRGSGSRFTEEIH